MSLLTYVPPDCVYIVVAIDVDENSTPLAVFRSYSSAIRFCADELGADCPDSMYVDSWIEKHIVED